MATRKSGTTRSSKKKPAASKSNATAGTSEELVALADFTESAYLHYSMYVILDRALPHVGDGLKPVQRRIIYAMSDLGLHANSKHKKSARTVGDVLGKFHPHGDSACYEAMVLMAQPFSYRYPLIDGQGNWGSTDDPKSFAAMRYTEARMTRYAQVLLSELGQGTVDWMPNFDGTLNEPRTLPARLPNVLLNGGSGIAVGMATDIPPHNIREVASAVIHLIDSPKATVKDLMKHINGPDYPTDAEIITPADEIRQMYETGNGSIRMRAVWKKEGSDVVITALPHQVSGSKILEQIASQMNAKKLPLVQDLRDESDHENPVRLVIEPRSNRVNDDELMNHLFATTDLERSYRVNLNVIGLNGRPRVFNLREILKEWIEYRMTTVTRRLQHRLDRVVDRLHILDGYLIAYLNIDEVIKIIRTEDEPKPVLMKRFRLSERQAEAILELKLRHLAKLEEMRIQGEQDELAAERDTLQTILNSKARLKTLVKKEITADAEEFGDARRSPIAQREAAKALDQSALIPAEPTTVVLSKLGWIRAAKGHEVDPTEMNYKQGDEYLHSVRGRTNQTLICLDSTGRAYGLAAHSLPSARSLGEPVSSGLKPPAGATFNGVMMGTEDTLYLLSTNQGYGFVARLGDMVTKTKAGKAVIRAGGAVETLTPAPVRSIEEGWVAVATSAGRLLVFEVSELPELAKGKGVKLFNVTKKNFESGEEKVVGCAVFEEGDKLRVHSGKRVLTLKPKDIDNYVGERAQRGLMLPKGYRQVARIDIESAE